MAWLVAALTDRATGGTGTETSVGGFSEERSNVEEELRETVFKENSEEGDDRETAERAVSEKAADCFRQPHGLSNSG